MLTLSNSVPGVILSWDSVTGAVYYLERSTNIGLPSGISLLQTGLIGQPGTTVYTDTTPAGSGPFFYRVGIQY